MIKETKYCPCCKKDKELNEFHKGKKNLDGLQTYCKQCKSDKEKEYYARPNIKKQKAEYHKKRSNQPEIRKRQKELGKKWKQDNKQRINKNKRDRRLNKWILDNPGKIKKIRKLPGYYTKEICENEALKYTTRDELFKNDLGVYSKARREGWLDDICKHMKLVGHLYKRCIYAFEFSDNHVYVGLSHDIDERTMNHMYEGPIKRHITVTKLIPIIKQLTKYLPVERAIEKEEYWQNKYKDEGWITLHKNKSGGLGGCKLKWTEENILVAALECTYLSEFYEKYGGAIINVRKLGIYKEITSHMIRKQGKPNSKSIIAIKDNKKLKFDSITEASYKLNIGYTNICEVLAGRNKTAFGYKFIYNNQL